MLFRLKNRTIRQRLTFIIMSVTVVSVLLTTLAISIIGVYSLRGSIIGELDVSASIVGDRNTAALLFNDDKQAMNNLNVFSVKQEIVQSCLYNQSGGLFASYTNEQYTGKVSCPTDLSTHTVVDHDRIQLMKPIVKMQDKIGYIYIESTLEKIDQYIEKQTTIALFVSGTTVLLSYLLALGLQRSISNPILSLAETARQVSIHKDYSIRAAPLGDAKTEYKNELVILTESFNDMLREIGARDSQLKKQNIALEKAKDAAEGANRAKSQFLANISHELRTPLNAIIGFSSILMNQLFGTLGNPKYLEYSHDINESGTHLLNIINDILDLSKAEAGKLALTYEEVHVGKAVQKCMTILADRATKGNVSVSSDVPKMLPPLMADRLRFIQIVLNILSNAIKFTQEGGHVEVQARLQEKAGEAAQFIITVRDTGIGMSREDIEKAFQSFGQVDSGLNRKYEGTGLGLPLTKKLMELHSGNIEIESEVGKGTLVSLIFPSVPPVEAEYQDVD